MTTKPPTLKSKFIEDMQGDGWEARNASGDVVKSPHEAGRLWTRGDQRFEGANTFIDHLGRERKAWQILAEANKTASHPIAELLTIPNVTIVN